MVRLHSEGIPRMTKTKSHDNPSQVEVRINALSDPLTFFQSKCHRGDDFGDSRARVVAVRVGAA